jgi:hypothetical protein
MTVRPAAAFWVFWLLCGAYTAPFVYRGWIPHDEGTLAQSAERVLSGEVPHRDFDDVYTGGLTYAHAAGMKLLGVNLRTPRLMLFAAFMAFAAAAHAIARRVAPPLSAALATALAMVWSAPNYFAALPSWYTLFFATWGVLASLRFLETRHRRWLVVAGACGGLSILAKVTGVYYLAAGVLFLIYVEQSRQMPEGAGPRARSRFWLVTALPAVVLTLALAGLMQSGAPAAALAAIFGPAMGVCVFLVWRERELGAGRVVDRLRELATLVWPFLAGAAAPLAMFVAWFWSQDALPDLVRGVLVLPQQRLTEAAMAPPPLATLALMAPYAALFLVHRAAQRFRLLAVVVAVGLGVALVFGAHPTIYRATWTLARSTPIVAMVAGVWLLAARRGAASARRDAPPETPHAQGFLLVATAVLVALVQFPYATPTYFYYAAPISILALVALVSLGSPATRSVHLVVAVYCLLFAVLFVNRSYGWNLGVQFIRYAPASRLDLPRAGLRVPAEDKQVYEELVRVLQVHAGGATIYAGPDCPEVYFLSGFRNPTRAIFDFLTPAQQDDAWMADLLARAPIRAAAVNTSPLFSPPLDAGALATLERRFPASVRVGQFIVRFER